MNQAMFLTPIKEIVSSSLMYDVDVECEALHWMLETSMYILQHNVYLSHVSSDHEEDVSHLGSELWWE